MQQELHLSVELINSILLKKVHEAVGFQIPLPHKCFSVLTHNFFIICILIWQLRKYGLSEV